MTDLWQNNYDFVIAADARAAESDPVCAMKLLHATIRRMVVTRVILAWAAVSLAAGGEVLYVEAGRVSQVGSEINRK